MDRRFSHHCVNVYVQFQCTVPCRQSQPVRSPSATARPLVATVEKIRRRHQPPSPFRRLWSFGLSASLPFTPSHPRPAHGPPAGKTKKTRPIRPRSPFLPCQVFIPAGSACSRFTPDASLLIHTKASTTMRAPPICNREMLSRNRTYPSTMAVIGTV